MAARNETVKQKIASGDFTRQTARVTPEMLRRIKVAAAYEGKSQEEIFLAALEFYLQDFEAKFLRELKKGK